MNNILNIMKLRLFFSIILFIRNYDVIKINKRFFTLTLCKYNKQHLFSIAHLYISIKYYQLFNTYMFLFLLHKIMYSLRII